MCEKQNSTKRNPHEAKPACDQSSEVKSWFLNPGVPYLDLGILDSEQGFQIVDFSYDLVMKMQFGMQIAFGVVLGGGSLTRSPKPGCDIWRPIWQPNSLIFIYFLNKNIEFIYQPKVSKISPPI